MPLGLELDDVLILELCYEKHRVLTADLKDLSHSLVGAFHYLSKCLVALASAIEAEPYVASQDYEYIAPLFYKTEVLSQECSDEIVLYITQFLHKMHQNFKEIDAARKKRTETLESLRVKLELQAQSPEMRSSAVATYRGLQRGSSLATIKTSSDEETAVFKAKISKFLNFPCIGDVAAFLMLQLKNLVSRLQDCFSELTHEKTFLSVSKTFDDLVGNSCSRFFVSLEYYRVVNINIYV